MPQAARYYLVLVLALLGLAWLASSVTSRVLSPPHDPDLTLFAAFYAAAFTGQIKELESTATALAEGASDRGLQAAGQHLARHYRQAVRFGHETVAESWTLSGHLRNFVQGLLNPGEVIEGTLVAIEHGFGGHTEVIRKYEELLALKATKQTYGWWIFWLTVVVGIALYIAFRKTLDPLFKALLSRVPWVEDFLIKPTKEQVSDQSLTPHP
jgi:hypothetical protein